MFVFRWYPLGALLALLVLPLCPVHAQSAEDMPPLADLVAAVHAHPDSDPAIHALERAVSNGLPAHLPTALLADLPVEATPISDDIGLLVVPKPYLITPAVDPQQDRTFAKITYLYGRNDDLFCRIHYSTPQDASLAGRMARLLSFAHQTYVAQTGTQPDNSDVPFDVWLCREGPAGGEQWAHNLYFYDLDAPRSSIEWIREIVHEYSHLALPAIGGYKDPEYWANGYLGERLIVRWMARTPDGTAVVQRIWGDFSGAANFNRLLIAPALALYQHVGPNPKWLARTDSDGMRYLIGQALTLDDKYGPHTLAAAFALLPREAGAADLAAAFAQVAKRPTIAKRP